MKYDTQSIYRQIQTKTRMHAKTLEIIYRFMKIGPDLGFYIDGAVMTLNTPNPSLRTSRSECLSILLGIGLRQIKIAQSSSVSEVYRERQWGSAKLTHEQGKIKLVCGQAPVVMIQLVMHERGATRLVYPGRQVSGLSGESTMSDT